MVKVKKLYITYLYSMCINSTYLSCNYFRVKSPDFFLDEDMGADILLVAASPWPLDWFRSGVIEADFDPLALLTIEAFVSMGGFVRFAPTVTGCWADVNADSSALCFLRSA